MEAEHGAEDWVLGHGHISKLWRKGRNSKGAFEGAVGQTGKNQRMMSWGLKKEKHCKAEQELSFHQRLPWVRKDECSELPSN